MATKSTTLEFEVKSTDHDRRTIDAVRETVTLSRDLQTSVAKKYPGVKVRIRRKEGLPIHALVHHIIVLIDWHAVASGAEKAIAQFATSEFLELTKKRVRNLFASPVKKQKDQATPSTTKNSAKKTSTARKVAADKKSSLPKPSSKPKKG